ncbi:hypothetical protein D3C87_2065510 [compost metagenome]
MKNVSLISVGGTEVYNSGPVSTGIINVKNIVSGMYILKIILIDGSVHTHKMFRIK